MAAEHNGERQPAAAGTVAEPSDLDRMIGEVAIRLRILTPGQVEQALAARSTAALDDAHDPGLVFVQQGMLSRAQLDYIETVRRFRTERIADKKFGELAVARGWTTSPQVFAAMEVQKLLFMRERKQVQIGEMLVRQHAITAEQRDILLSVQQRARQEMAAQAEPPAVAGAAPAVTPAAATPVAAAADESAPSAVGAAEAVQGASSERHAPRGFKVTLSSDHMAAFVTLPAGGTRPDEEALRAALHESGVSFGVDEEALAQLCAADAPVEQAIQVARGEPPEPSRDAALEYLFETAPLKAGHETSDETIDFKDRGDIPQVKAEDVLARKTPAVEGRPGMDVYGHTLKPRKPKDRRLAAGSGTQLGDDKLTLLAAVAGHPVLSPSGAVSVFPEYRIEGDLGYATGHVDFNGRVIVSGLVQPGFKVRCGELMAAEVEGAEIEATGDVVIRGGVIGTRIRTEGSVRAKYFHTSRIDALGDVMAQSELFDSEVESSGAFHGDHCKLLGSRVSAKGGVTAEEIGSDSSAPCTIIVGIDERVQHQIEQLDEASVEAEATLAAAEEELAALGRRRDETDGRIGAMAQVQDKAQVRQRELTEAVDGGDTRVAAQLELVSEQVQSAEADLNVLFAEQEALNAAQEGLRQQQIEQRAQVADNRATIAELREWTQENPGKAELKVAKNTYQGTFIRAPHDEMRLNEDKQRLWIAEQEVTDEHGQSSWRFVHRS